MTDEETEAQSLSYFPKVTLLVSGRVRIWTQVCALKCPFHHASCIPCGDGWTFLGAPGG